MEQLSMQRITPKQGGSRREKAALTYDAIVFLRKQGWAVYRKSDMTHSCAKRQESFNRIDDRELRWLATQEGWVSP